MNNYALINMPFVPVMNVAVINGAVNQHDIILNRVFRDVEPVVLPVQKNISPSIKKNLFGEPDEIEDLICKIDLTFLSNEE